MSDFTDEVFSDIEKIHKITLSEREKMLMHMYYGMLTLAIQSEGAEKITCEMCKRLYVPKRYDQKFCSNKCKSKDYYHRKKAGVPFD